MPVIKCSTCGGAGHLYSHPNDPDARQTDCEECYGEGEWWEDEVTDEDIDEMLESSDSLEERLDFLQNHVAWTIL